MEFPKRKTQLLDKQANPVMGIRRETLQHYLEEYVDGVSFNTYRNNVHILRIPHNKCTSYTDASNKITECNANFQNL